MWMHGAPRVTGIGALGFRLSCRWLRARWRWARVPAAGSWHGCLGRLFAGSAAGASARAPRTDLGGGHAFARGFGLRQAVHARAIPLSAAATADSAAGTASLAGSTAAAGASGAGDSAVGCRYGRFSGGHAFAVGSIAAGASGAGIPLRLALQPIQRRAQLHSRVRLRRPALRASAIPLRAPSRLLREQVRLTDRVTAPLPRGRGSLGARALPVRVRRVPIQRTHRQMVRPRALPLAAPREAVQPP